MEAGAKNPQDCGDSVSIPLDNIKWIYYNRSSAFSKIILDYKLKCPPVAPPQAVTCFVFT